MSKNDNVYVSDVWNISAHNFVCIIFRPHRMQSVHKMRRSLLIQISHVARFWCLTWHTDVLCKNDWTYRDDILGLDLLGPSNYILDGVKIRRIHSQPPRVTIQWCGLLPN